MLRALVRSAALCAVMLLGVAGTVHAEDAPEEDDKLISGMSIVGNDDAPKSLVIVPWKTSVLGHTLDVSKGLDDGRQPVDKEVFMRALAYYQIRAASR